MKEPGLYNHRIDEEKGVFLQSIGVTDSETLIIYNDVITQILRYINQKFEHVKNMVDSDPNIDFDSAFAESELIEIIENSDLHPRVQIALAFKIGQHIAEEMNNAATRLILESVVDGSEFINRMKELRDKKINDEDKQRGSGVG